MAEYHFSGSVSRLSILPVTGLSTRWEVNFLLNISPLNDSVVPNCGAYSSKAPKARSALNTVARILPGRFTQMPMLSLSFLGSARLPLRVGEL